jgi:hypothetical protein
MNEKNTMTKTEEELALLEVETSELQAIVGGYLAGHHEPPPPDGTRWPTPKFFQ